MHPNPGWEEILARLICTLIGGALIGINREEKGRAAGLRTTMLVCLAASVSMIQCNLLLTTTGKTSEMFGVMDLLRFPLGILTGVGFIGAGTILRKDNLVLGVTTAATLWFVTVTGLCFGGGQIGLGFAATVLGIFILWCLKWIERHWKQERHAKLTITTAHSDAVETEIINLLALAGYQSKISDIAYLRGAESRKLTCLVRWQGRSTETQPPAVLKDIASRFAVEMEWSLQQS